MSTYFSKDNVPTMCSRDPEHVLYNEASLSGNMSYLNYPSLDNVGGSNQSQQNTFELAVPSNTVLPGASMSREDLVTSRLGNHQYNAWRGGRDELPFIQSGPVNNTAELVQNHVTDDPPMSMGMQLNLLNGHNLALVQSNLSAIKGQGLSLSLGTQIPASSFQYHPDGSNVSLMSPHQITSSNVEPTREDSSRDIQTHVYPSPYGLATLPSTIPNSKYLKAAQQLLDEVVNVRKALKRKSEKGQVSADNTGPKESDGNPSDPNESASNSTELSPCERQDLQNKMTKLLAMLDEVDRRYKQYYNQMLIVVSSFDVIAGCSASKPYTALALQTISRHFRSLKDAINRQIQATRKSLGEQDGSNICGGISRLRYIDQHLKQQRVFQQFGMIQPHAWRPQRGLPENSVSILRAWLFEHFLHPYPKDSDKIMLARETGLTRSQVSNWFINARVRLWKPMVEEMYKEEIGDTEIESNSSSENAPKSRDELGLSEDKDGYQSKKFATEKSQLIQFNDTHKSNLLLNVGADGAVNGFQNKVGVESMNYMTYKPNGLDTTTENAALLQDTLIHTEGNVRFTPYQMAELERYGSAGVSLTLGLQHCEGGLQVSDGQHGFVSMRGDEMFNAASSVGTDTADYSYMNQADRRHRFGPSQLLHDFVA